ncbi:PP2C family serine/threonine-protein phosphatase [Paraburkholderia agricolaris]|uniref:PP2C family serine/threonine-protein phosphatase n=1 Tax=Paraburkholderia agricolaris TaxID=2152888 RepID=A0ABW8ZWR5_9BURK
MYVASLGPANEHFDAEQWRVRVSSVLGASHERRGAPCQDAYCARANGRRCVAVVADGAGSAPHGGDGAALAARSIVDTLADLHVTLSSCTILDALANARAALQVQSNAAADKLRSFATTIVGVALQGTRGVFFHLGDGLAMGFCGSAPSRVQALSRGTASEFANVSSFLTDPDWRESVVFTPLWSVDAVMLMSDGIAPFAIDTKGSPKPAFHDPILSFLAAHAGEVGAPALAELMSKDVVRRTSGDDCTLLWAGRLSER